MSLGYESPPSRACTTAAHEQMSKYKNRHIEAGDVAQVVARLSGMHGVLGLILSTT